MERLKRSARGMSNCQAWVELEDLLYEMGLNNTKADGIVYAYKQYTLNRLLHPDLADVLELTLEELEGKINEVHEPQGDVPLVIERKADGTFSREFVACTVSDLEGHIGHTLEKQPDAVWVFDPETLELLRVPTYKETLRHAAGDDEAIARLRDIEGGKF